MRRGILVLLGGLLPLLLALPVLAGLPDTDGDGTPDASDNCILVDNGPIVPDAGGNVQLDADGDGFGNVCDCDYNDDGGCGQPDYSVFLACFGLPIGPDGPADDPSCEESDMNGDGGVGQPDYSLFISLFGGAPGPAAMGGEAEIRLSDLDGNPISGGVDMGQPRFSVQGNRVDSLARVERVFVIENLGGMPLTVTPSSNAADLIPRICSTEGVITRCLSGTRSVAPGGVGALQLTVEVLPDANPPPTGPDSATVTLTTNDPLNPSIQIPVTWTWVQGSGAIPDGAITPMFLDLGAVPTGQFHDRSLQVLTGQAGGQLTSLTVSGSGFSIVTPNPDPFMPASGFPVPQVDPNVPLRYAIRAAPNASSGVFLGTLAAVTGDPDEPVIEALIVARGASAPALDLPNALITAATDNAVLRTPVGSERLLLPIPSGGDGLDYDATSDTAYLYSTAAVFADPNPPANLATAYLFKVPPGGARAVLLTKSLTEDAVGLAADFSAGLLYMADVGLSNEDLIRVTETGSATIINSGGFSIGSRLAVDSFGNVYVSKVIKDSVRRLRKFSSAGNELLAFGNTTSIGEVEIADDVVYAINDFNLNLTGREYDLNGVLTGSFGVPAPVASPFDLEWFAVDPIGNLLFADRPSASTLPQTLYQVEPGGAESTLGELPVTRQGDL